MTIIMRAHIGARSFVAGLAWVLALLLCDAACAQPRLPGGNYSISQRPPDLPSQEIAPPPQGGQAVTFASPQQEGSPLLIPAMLFKPTGPANGAVVIDNATPGWSDFREGHFGRALSSAGYAVLAINTYGPRQIADTAYDYSKLSTHAQVLDAFAARRYLISIGYGADRMAIMGTGRGGTIALLAADRTFVRSEKDRFGVGISIGADCIFHPRQPSPASRLFMAIGEKDAVAGMASCQNLAKDYAAAGGDVTVKVYPGASSGFEGHPLLRLIYHDPSMETFADCNVLVERDGRSSYSGKSFAEGDTQGLHAEMRKSCVKRGASGWTNTTQKANLTLDLIEFLDSKFRF
jgi:dienelactone hydrolase